jgi:hypothetical protein
VVKIDRQNRVSGWKNEITGAHALAVDKNRILLWGGYGQNKTRCMVQDFGSEQISGTRELILSLPGGVSLFGANFMGRGSILYAFDEKRWFSFDLSQIG